MDIKILLQALARPWFIELSQADYWGGIISDFLIHKRIDAIPNQDTRSSRWGQAYEFPRVNSNGDITSDGPVQLIRLEGPLMKYDSCGSMGMQSLQQGIRAANLDATIESMVIVGDTPGGSVDGTDNFAREVKASRKPIVTFVNGMLCSAGYWIGSSAMEVVADDANNGYNATIGSIGTMAMWKDKSKAEEAVGIKTHAVYATKSSRKNAYGAEANQGNYTRLIQELDNLNESFLSAVQQNRAGKLNLDKEDVLQGDTYDAREALKNGLIDKIGSFQYAVKRSLQLAKTIKK